MEPRHRLLLELGRGGMGTVYLANARGPAGFNKLKVVKRLRADLAHDLQFVTMFLDEARLTARLTHPNIGQTNEVGFDGTHYFIEMEYLEGPALDVVVRRARDAGGVPIALHVWVLTQVLAGLDYAHDLTDGAGNALCVVHRDVSPHNVILTYDGGVKLVDFGIAKAADSSTDTRTGVVKGKVAYMAPEQALRGAVDRRADVFAVGVMLWQALTGERLWGDRSDTEILLALERGEIPAKADAVDPELASICVRALARAPEDRFATAAEFQAALEDHLERRRARVSPRVLARFVSDLFGGERAERRAAVERARERADSAQPLDVEVPVLGAGDPSNMPTSTDASMVNSAPGSAVSPTRRLNTAPRGRPRSRVWALGAGATAVCLLGLAAGRASFASRSTPREVAASVVPRAPAGCRDDAECTARAGARSVCRADHSCVLLASDDCRVLADEPRPGEAATLWFGAMLPLKGPDAAAFGEADANAIELARRDFALAHGLPAVRPGTGPRPLGVVMCDDSVDASRAAHHLVDDIGVPAVIGFYRSQEVVDLASTLFIPRGVVALAAINTSPMVTRIPQPPDVPRMVWRTTVSSSQSASPMAAIVSEVYETRLRQTRVLAPGEAMRVALVRPGNSAGLSFSDAFFSRLAFNGKSAMMNAADYRQLVFADPAAGAPPDYAATVAELTRFAPHVIVYIDGSYFVDNILLPLEKAWPKTARFRPRYASTGLMEGETLRAFVEEDPSRRERLLSADLPASTEPNAKLTMRYNEAFSPKVTRENAPSVTYDAFYVAAYAAYAVGDAPVTGVSLARAIARLTPPGDRIEVGPATIFDVFKAIRSGKNVDLEGAGTNLDFDAETGEPPVDFAVYCFGRSHEAGFLRYATRESGLVYNASSGAVTGTLHCD
jgi:serine/threonine-protein kinase